MSQAVIEFFFDCSSPWTYLAFTRIEPLAAEFGARLVWRPFLVGGVFNTVNPSVYASREQPVPAKQAYMRKDLQDWARLAGIRIRFPPSVFPVNSVKAMRGCLLLEEEERLVPFARAAFAAYWGEDKDIAQDAVLAEICAGLGIDPARFFAGIAAPGIKDRLRANTEELVRRGGFGTPTLFLDGDDMYFGNDRLPLVRESLRQRA
ncbi:MAG: 2-hydroxychromene-2-carboxylate isomerase [Stellaceae bacterium]